MFYFRSGQFGFYMPAFVNSSPNNVISLADINYEVENALLAELGAFSTVVSYNDKLVSR